MAGLAAEEFPGEIRGGEPRSRELKHPNGRAVLAALLDGKLYYRNADNKVFITDGGETTLALTDPLTLAAAGSGNPDEYSRITTNNSLRKALRSAVASFALSDPDAGVRLAAVREMLRSIDEDSEAILRASVEKETDADVKKAMREGLALADLESRGGRNAPCRRGRIERFTESGCLQPAHGHGAPRPRTVRFRNPTNACAPRPAKSSPPSIPRAACTRRSRRCSSA